MKPAAVFAALVALQGAKAAEECAISCDPCHGLQKQQCLGNQMCQYSVTSGDETCSSKSAIDRVTIEDGDEKGGVLRKRLQALGCAGFYTQNDCRTARLNGVAGGNCWWHDCDVEANGGIPYCGEGRDGTGCRPDNYVLAKDRWDIDNDGCMKKYVDGTVVLPEGGYASQTEDVLSCTVGRFFSNKRLGQDVFHFCAAMNNRIPPNADCPGCPTDRSAYPVWSDIASHLDPQWKTTYLPVIRDSYRVPMSATIGFFQDRSCKSGVDVHINKNSHLTPYFLGHDSWSLANYDAVEGGPLVTLYQCCSHPVLKSSMTPAQRAAIQSDADVSVGDKDHGQYADYHNSMDDAWNAPADPDAWKDDSSQYNDDGDGWSDYFHALTGDYADDYLESDSHNDYYNDFVVNMEIRIDGANAELHLSLPAELKKYRDNVFQTKRRDNKADNPGHAGVRNVRSVPNPFSDGDEVYVHFQGGWMYYYSTGSTPRGLLLYGVDAETEEQLWGIDGEKTGAPLSDDGKQQAWNPISNDGQFSYSDYDGDGETDWGTRLKSVGLKNL